MCLKGLGRVNIRKFKIQIEVKKSDILLFLAFISEIGFVAPESKLFSRRKFSNGCPLSFTRDQYSYLFLISCLFQVTRKCFEVLFCFLVMLIFTFSPHFVDSMLSPFLLFSYNSHSVANAGLFMLSLVFK